MQQLPENKIGFWGITNKEGNNDGYSYAGFKLASALKDNGYKPIWKANDCKVSLSFTQPHGYCQSKDSYRIGYSPWESTVVPDKWIPLMETQDVIWTTSTFCKEVFLENGIKGPIEVVPHGIDKNDFTLSRRKRNDEPFTFLHIGEPSFRKGGQMVFDAYKRLFTRNDDVRLIIKAMSYSTIRKNSEKMSGSIKGFDGVTVIRDNYSVSQLNELYNSANCFLYPTNGEGFGLLPFQAAATGMPTIATGWSGITDFSKYLIELDYKVADSESNYHLGQWAFPSFDDLCDKMMYVYKNYDSLAEDSYHKGLALRKEFTWEGSVLPKLEGLF